MIIQQPWPMIANRHSMQECWHPYYHGEMREELEVWLQEYIKQEGRPETWVAVRCVFGDKTRSPHLAREFADGLEVACLTCKLVERCFFFGETVRPWHVLNAMAYMIRAITFSALLSNAPGYRAHCLIPTQIRASL